MPSFNQFKTKLKMLNLKFKLKLKGENMNVGGVVVLNFMGIFKFDEFLTFCLTLLGVFLSLIRKTKIGFLS